MLVRSVLAVMAIALVGACGPSQSRQQARAAAQAFEESVARQDGASACALLVPEARNNLEATKACDQALLELDLPGGAIRSVEVWSGEAQVRVAQDTLFLSRFPTGWRVSAAGCQKRTGQPYDCDVEA